MPAPAASAADIIDRRMMSFDRRRRLMHEPRQIQPSEEVEAKKAEIARRYTRERRPLSQLERILSLRRSQLIRLFKIPRRPARR
jgi:hypothetical protein